MSFKTISFKTDWQMFSKDEREAILETQIKLRREYERWANPDYFRKSIWSAVAEGLAADAKKAREMQ